MYTKSGDAYMNTLEGFGIMNVCINRFGIRIGDRRYLNEYTPFTSVNLWYDCCVILIITFFTVHYISLDESLCRLLIMPEGLRSSTSVIKKVYRMHYQRTEHSASGFITYPANKKYLNDILFISYQCYLRIS